MSKTGWWFVLLCCGVSLVLLCGCERKAAPPRLTTPASPARRPAGPLCEGLKLLNRKAPEVDAVLGQPTSVTEKPKRVRLYTLADGTKLWVEFSDQQRSVALLATLAGPAASPEQAAGAVGLQVRSLRPTRASGAERAWRGSVGGVELKEIRVFADRQDTAKWRGVYARVAGAP